MEVKSNGKESRADLGVTADEPSPKQQELWHRVRTDRLVLSA